MKFFLNFARWLFNSAAYGNIENNGRLYRRRIRTREVEMKTTFGWRPVAEIEWYKFVPDDYVNQSIRMPNRKWLVFKNRWRDSIGEQAFNDWVDGERRLALEEMIRRKSQKQEEIERDITEEDKIYFQVIYPKYRTMAEATRISANNFYSCFNK